MLNRGGCVGPGLGPNVLKKPVERSNYGIYVELTHVTKQQSEPANCVGVPTLVLIPVQSAHGAMVNS